MPGKNGSRPPAAPMPIRKPGGKQISIIQVGKKIRITIKGK